MRAQREQFVAQGEYVGFAVLQEEDLASALAATRRIRKHEIGVISRQVHGIARLHAAAADVNVLHAQGGEIGTRRIAERLKVVGLMNMQFAIEKDKETAEEEASVKPTVKKLRARKGAKPVDVEAEESAESAE